MPICGLAGAPSTNSRDLPEFPQLNPVVRAPLVHPEPPTICRTLGDGVCGERWRIVGSSFPTNLARVFDARMILVPFEDRSESARPPKLWQVSRQWGVP